MHPWTILCALLLTGVAVASQSRTIIDTPLRPADHALSPGKEYEVLRPQRRNKRDSPSSRPVGNPSYFEQKPSELARPIRPEKDALGSPGYSWGRPFGFPESEFRPSENARHIRSVDMGLPDRENVRWSLSVSELYYDPLRRKESKLEYQPYAKLQTIQDSEQNVGSPNIPYFLLLSDDSNVGASSNWARPIPLSNDILQPSDLIRPLRPQENELTDVMVSHDNSKPFRPNSNTVNRPVDEEVGSSEPLNSFARPAILPEDGPNEVSVSSLARPALTPEISFRNPHSRPAFLPEVNQELPSNNIARPAFWSESKDSPSNMARPAFRPSFNNEEAGISNPAIDIARPAIKPTDIEGRPSTQMDWSLPRGPEYMTGHSEPAVSLARPAMPINKLQGQENTYSLARPLNLNYNSAAGSRPVDSEQRHSSVDSIRRKRGAPQPPMAPGLPGHPGQPGLPGLPGQPGSVTIIHRGTRSDPAPKEAIEEQEVAALAPPYGGSPLRQGYPGFIRPGPSAQAYPGFASATSYSPRPYGAYPGYPAYPGGTYPGFPGGGVYPGVRPGFPLQPGIGRI